MFIDNVLHKSSICIFFLLFCFQIELQAHDVNSSQQANNSNVKVSPTTQTNDPNTILLEYSKALNEESKAHREFLEDFYTKTFALLGVITTAIGGILVWFNWSSKKEIQHRVDQRFRETIGELIEEKAGTVEASLKALVEEKGNSFEKYIETTRGNIQLQSEQLNKQEKIIKDLVIFSMAFNIYEHLKEIYKKQMENPRGEYLFSKNDAFINDLFFLRDHGFIGFLNIWGLEHGQNLVNIIELTPIGLFYVEQRELRQSSESG